MRFKRILFLSLVPLTLLLVACGVLGIIAKKRPKLTMEQCVALAVQRMEQKKYDRAVHYFGLAASKAEKAQDRARYHWAAVEAAQLQGDKKAALSHAQAAWREGKKEGRGRRKENFYFQN